jgi:DNA (cytosine-5)-methyltransferase 1
MIYYIDLFSGAGGTTTGIHLVGSKVVACVNHDNKAISSHKANHPAALHLTEDVRDYKVIVALKHLVEKIRCEDPEAFIIIWASLECTNFSKAKGGLPRDADSRTLAYTLYNYIDELNPDLVQIENVREFMAWGPLDKNGRPVSRSAGKDYLKWKETIKRFGYEYDSKMLNAANFGAYTSRERFFGQFSKNMPIQWPEPTHAKKPDKAYLFHQPLEKWKHVREVLDLQDEGKSIFNRKKALVDATLNRIYAGVEKFVVNGEDGFAKVYNSGWDEHRVKSLNEPVGSLTTQNSHAFVKCNFVMKNYSGYPKSKVHDLERPIGTVTTIDHHSIVSIDRSFLTSYYGNGGAHNIKEPCPTVTTKDRFNLVQPQFIDQQYGNSKPTSFNEPLSTITANPKFNLDSVNWLLNPQFSNTGNSIDKPCFTLIARMDKRPPYLMTAAPGMEKVQIKEGDTEMMVKLKKLCQQLGISDVKMRMLKIVELLQIQGFPKDYKLIGSQADQKKFIGNAVEVNMAKAIAATTKESVNQYLNNIKKQTA